MKNQYHSLYYCSV